jgi:hypothetical protein
VESLLPDLFVTKFFLKPVLTLCIHDRRVKAPSVFTTGSRDSPVKNTQGSRFTNFKEHTTILKETNILKIDCKLLNYLRLMFGKLTYPRDSNRLPGVFFNRESILNTKNNSTNTVFKKITIVSGRANLYQENLFYEKKTGDEKSRDTVPLRSKILNFKTYFSPSVACTHILKILSP